MKNIFLFVFVVCLHSIFSMDLSMQMISSAELQKRRVAENYLIKADTIQGKWRDFFVGTSLFEKGNFSAAFKAYQNAEDSLPEFIARIRLQEVLCLKELGYTDSARVLLENSSKLSQKNQTKYFYKTLAELMLNDSLSVKLLMMRLDTVLQILPKGEFKTATLFNTIKRVKDSLPSELLKKRLFPIIKKSPGTKWASSSYTLIQKKYGTRNPFQKLEEQIAISQHVCSARKNKTCLESVEKLLKKKPLDLKIQIKLRSNLAAVLYRTKKYVRAEKLYRELVSKYGITAYRQLQIARSLRKQGKIEEANKEYALFRSRYPKHSKTVEMIWTKAQKFEKEKKWKQAAQEYKKISSDFGKNRRAKWAGYRQGLVFYKAKKYQKAIQAFSSVIANKKLLRPRTGAFFLTGRSYHYLKQDSLAKKYYLKAIADFPVSYYAHLARKFLLEDSLMSKEKIPGIHSEKMSLKDAFLWVQTQNSLAATYSLMKVDSLLEPIKRLLQTGFREDARLVWNLLPKKVRNRADVEFVAARIFMQLGDLAQGYRIARKLLIGMKRQIFVKAPDSVFELFYPRPFLSSVLYNAIPQGLDPLFVYGLMRQESTFDEEISSPVGAYGLMQIMPSTGRRLADKLELSSFNANMLKNPLMAIRLGVFYLGGLKKKLGDEAWVLANYNAGPKAAIRWKKSLKSEPSEIAYEGVTYWETRNYIMRVLGNWWTYQMIYKQPVKYLNP